MRLTNREKRLIEKALGYYADRVLDEKILRAKAGTDKDLYALLQKEFYELRDKLRK